MAAGDLVAQDYQYEFNNFVIGVDTPFDVEEISALFGYPQVRRSLDDRLGAHGGVAGRHYVPTRDFIVSCNLLAATDTEFRELRTEMSRAFAPRSDPSDQLRFVYQHPGAPKRFVLCRPTAVDLTADRRYALKYPALAVRFEQTDPRHYDLSPRTHVITPPTAGGGLTFPLEFPLQFEPGETGDSVIENIGTAPAHWRGTIRGPATNPVIVDVTRGFELRMEGFILQAGQQLVFDSRERSVRLGTQTRRRFLTATSKFFTIPATDPITVRLLASDTTSSTRLTIVYHRAYWGD